MNTKIKTQHPSSAVRMRAMKRDRFTCVYCGVSGSEAELEIDHIIPISKGGSNHISNLATSCRRCNQEKGDSIIKVKNMDNHHNSIVGLWATVPSEECQWGTTVFIHSRINENYYLIQGINAMTGEPNVLKLIHFNEMLSWHFWDNEAQVSYYLDKFFQRYEHDKKAKIPCRLEISNGKYVTGGNQ